MMSVVKLVDWKYQVPLSIHFLVTSRCNLNCPKCYYKSEGEVSLETALRLFDEWASNGVISVAIGGGEPLLHPRIEQITYEAKRRGFYVALTTNGTITKHIHADRVHISFDSIHGTSFEQARRAVKFFSKIVPTVGVNHIVTDAHSLKKALKLDVPEITLLMEKPTSQYDSWPEAFEIVKRHKNLWIDACLAQKLGIRKCRQGVTSMCVDQKLMAGRCSNTSERVAYTTLAETWKIVRTRTGCPLEGAFCRTTAERR